MIARPDRRNKPDEILEKVTGKKNSSLLPQNRAWLILLIILVVTAVIRVRFLPVPLERDEGEYAYTAQLMLQGIPPYAKVYNMKLPGIYAAYTAVISVFGETRTGIHTGLLIINGATIVLLFLLGRRLYGSTAGTAAAAFFALLSVSQPVQGAFANAEHFVLLPALGGLYALLRAMESGRPASLLLSGALLGTAIVMKQHGAAFALFGGLFLVIRELRSRPFRLAGRAGAAGCAGRCGFFLMGVLTPLGATLLFLAGAGVFDTFRYWAVDYTAKYLSAVPFADGMSALGRQAAEIAGSSTLIWCLAGAGLIIPAWDRRARRGNLFTSGFLLFSFLAICPGLYFRPHYFVLILPAAALLAGIAAGASERLKGAARFRTAKRTVPFFLVLIALSHSAYQQRDYLFHMTPEMISRATYETNPFPESLEIAEYIREHTSKHDTIAVLGSEPQIYFYSGRHSASGHIYTYPLMEKGAHALKMQQEMISEIEAARPAFLVYANISTSWLVEPESNPLIGEWLEEYCAEHYEQVGVIDILHPEPTYYCWGEEAALYSPLSEDWLSVFRLRDDSF